MNSQETSISRTKDIARLSDWEVLLSITRQMLAMASAGDWDCVLPLEEERRARIARFFATTVSPQEADSVREGILEILESDKRLLELSQQQRGKRSADVLQFRQKAAAQRAYAATAAG
jgi:hypothetical protein